MIRSKKKKPTTPSAQALVKLPRPNAAFLGSGVMIDPEFNVMDDERQPFTPEALRGIICNPIYAGVPPFEPIVDEETWVRAATTGIREQGVEQFLVNMLFVLRMSMVSTLVEEAEDDPPRAMRKHNQNPEEEP